MTVHTENVLLTPEQLAARLSLSSKTLQDWRYKGKGPRFLHLNGESRGAVRYRLSAVVEWENGHEETASSVAASAAQAYEQVPR